MDQEADPAVTESFGFASRTTHSVMRFALRLALIFGAIALAYVASFFIFHRAHLAAGIRDGMRTTSVFWRVEDNSVNRFLVAFYSPLTSLETFEMPIEWD